MKRFVKNVAIMLVLGLVLSFSACGVQVEKEEKTISISVTYEDVKKDFEVTAVMATAEDAMKALMQSNAQFTYEGISGDYGLMIMSMLERSVSGNEFWGVYTDTLRLDDRGVPNAMEEYTIECDGKTYYSTAVGVSSYVVEDGEELLFALGTF